MRAADVARRRGPELCIVSLLIWLCELVISLLLVYAATVDVGAADAVDNALGFLEARLVISWLTIDTNPQVAPALAIATIAILLPWPMVTALYLARRRHEPQRTSAAVRSKRRVGK